MDETLYGDAGANTLIGGTGDDYLYGYAGADILYGGDGNDVLYGGDGQDTLYGGAGNDQLTGGGDGDRMYGGTGDDTYYVQGDGDQVIEAAGEGKDTVVSYLAGYTLKANCEILLIAATAATDSNGYSSGNGNELANAIRGSEGKNQLHGLGGNDSIYGVGGDDVISGGLGNDVLDGGAGTDLVTFKVGAVAGVGVTVDLSITSNQNTGQGIDKITGFENLEGTFASDVLSGTNGVNEILGLAGDDTIRGRGGNDSLAGGAGADTFIFDAAGAANGVDMIRGFETGIDKLAFAAADGYDVAASLTLGSGAVGGGAQFIFDAVTHSLWYDADGAGGAAQVQLATFAAATVSAGDFVFL